MRRYVLVSYDISDQKRWRKVYKIVRGYGMHVQYSVFLCQLTDQDEAELKQLLLDVIHQSVDQVIFARLGTVQSNAAERNMSFIGRDFIPLDLRGFVF
ncbi:CRISPR-associated endonuclease Cas2 [Alicyclobacillus cycloheptanicus]|uniref:CRISPR-associated endoribonuclease Cas2 n=1 Tax=Alicyclobacillus cycloheptanicus TaxID=1457 RepID=A0ABT9XHT2_9BACL|nr:CRISPR-associated endonuclease Cas2 [Alicyclobacillus cycloheptanicus]MDQ0189867.1 CRISPR-associated protein Cas2 [Alicyclobacillus cycloheptanicus]WDM02451.1 CRISPR-associated endonuclease Cas2 [Alicyclobacillus cycloheptanicus]